MTKPPECARRRTSHRTGSSCWPSSHPSPRPRKRPCSGRRPPDDSCRSGGPVPRDVERACARCRPGYSLLSPMRCRRRPCEPRRARSHEVVLDHGASDGWILRAIAAHTSITTMSDETADVARLGAGRWGTLWRYDGAITAAPMSRRRCDAGSCRHAGLLGGTAATMRLTGRRRSGRPRLPSPHWRTTPVGMSERDHAHGKSDDQ
jgi:hypothetical protein